MVGTRCNLHRLFAALLLISSMSLVFLVNNFHDLVLEVRQGPNLQRSNTGGQDHSENEAAKESLSDAEEALMGAYSEKDQKKLGQTHGQGEVKIQVLQPPKPQAKVLEPPAKALERPTKVLEPLQSQAQLPAPPEPPLPMPKNAQEPPEGKPESPKTSEKTLKPPGPPKQSSEKPSNSRVLGPRQTSAPKPATPKLKAEAEWVNKSANCLPLPRKVHIAPIPQEGTWFLL